VCEFESRLAHSIVYKAAFDLIECRFILAYFAEFGCATVMIVEWAMPTISQILAMIKPISYSSEPIAMQIKRWESPRYEGRNHKGKKKSARQRQIKKQTQVWIQKLKGNDSKEKGDKGSGPNGQTHKKRSGIPPLLFLWRFGVAHPN
jgi:hypothetical protein